MRCLPPLRLRQALLALALLLAAGLLTPARATEIQSLKDAPTTLAAQTRPPRSLALLVATLEDLPEAQRLLTLAEAHQLHTLILVVLPDADPATIRHAAARYFRSDFSQQRVYYIKASALPTPAARAALLLPDAPPSWLDRYPTDAEFSQ